MEEEHIKDLAMDTAKTINREFVESNIIPKWNNYSSVSRFKSVRRAIRRGHVDMMFGIIYPNRPFNNKKSTIGRSNNQLKKKIYGQIKGV